MDQLKAELEAYRELIAFNPTHPSYLNRLIEILFQLGEIGEASDHMLVLEKVYRRKGYVDLARSMESLRLNACGSGKTVSKSDSQFQWFAGLAPDLINKLFIGAKKRCLQEGDTLIKQGNCDDSIYIVLEGELAILVQYSENEPPRFLHTLCKGSVIGEIAFLEGGDRSSTVVANTSCTVMQLSNKRVLKCLMNHPEFGDALRCERELRSALTVINHNQLLSKLSYKDKSMFATVATWKNYPAYSAIGHSQNTPSWVGIVATGVIRVAMQDSSGNSHLLTRRERGDTIADFQVISGEPLSVDLIAVSDVQILQVPAEIFREVLEQHPTIKDELVHSSVLRLASTIKITEAD